MSVSARGKRNRGGREILISTRFHALYVCLPDLALVDENQCPYPCGPDQGPSPFAYRGTFFCFTGPSSLAKLTRVLVFHHDIHPRIQDKEAPRRRIVASQTPYV